MKLNIIYRCCELETGIKPKRPCRPKWFSKEECLNNLLEAFLFIKNPNVNVEFYAVHDGPEGPLFEVLDTYTQIKIVKINENSNEKSLQTSLNLGLEVTGDYTYFIEDDYRHKENALSLLVEGLEFNNGRPVTLYDHPDRYIRTDDIDYGKTYLYMGKSCYWRTAESTTCTWAIEDDLYKLVVAKVAKSYGLNDRQFFRNLYHANMGLLTPMPGASTHCHEPFLSPYVNWEDP